MTRDEHERQRANVQASANLSDSKEQRQGVYARHPLAQVVAQGTPTIGSQAQSIRELGEMLVAADAYPVFSERLAECERLAVRIGSHLATLRGLIDAEHADAMGALDPDGSGEERAR
jgi:hypothetical protein